MKYPLLAQRREPLPQLGHRRLGALGVDACEVHVLRGARLERLRNDFGQRRPERAELWVVVQRDIAACVEINWSVS